MMMPAWLVAIALAALAGAADLEAPVLYPPLPQTPRLQFLKSYGSPEDFGEGDSWFTRLVFGKRRTSEGLGKPYGVAVFGPKVYLCDTGHGDVRVFDLNRRASHWLGKAAHIEFNKPVNIAIDERTGDKFVADTALKRVVVFNAKDEYTRSFEDPNGEWRPTDVAVSSSSVFVLDIANHQVRVLDRATGAVLRKIGSAGNREGEMFKPTNLLLDEEGNIFVSDTVNFRIQKFDPEGRYLKSFGQLGRQPGTFSRPKGIALDRLGRLYAVDAGFDNVQIFDKDGNTLMVFGGTGNDPGQMYLPAKVALDYDPENVDLFQKLADPRMKLTYLIWVTNQYGPRRLSVYGYGDWRESNDAKPKL